MFFRLIACNIFQREACQLLATTPHTVDPVFIDLGLHEEPGRLRARLQLEIDAAAEPRRDGRRYDAVLLLFGLCGNAAVGLHARGIPLVVPRAHDCATLLLGSRAAYIEHFGENPSQPFGCVGYLERNLGAADRGGVDRPIADPRYRQYLEQYGEENARYIWETMHPPAKDGRAVFIATPSTRGLGAEQRFRAQAEADGLTYVELAGSLRLIEGLLAGEWSDADYLRVLPGEQIRAVYDQDEVIRSEEVDHASPSC